MLRFDVTILFDKYCKEILNGNEEKLRFIKEHERRNIVLTNLCDQITRYESRVISGKANEVIRNNIINCVAVMFIERSTALRDLQNQSSAKKHTKSDYDKRLDAMEEIKTAVIEIDRSID